MTTLHILNKSPQHAFPASQCRQFYSQGDAILLIEDAVYHALPDTFNKLCKAMAFTTPPPIYALKDDLDARGIFSSADKDIKVVSYHEFVELTMQHNKTSSWY